MRLFPSHFIVLAKIKAGVLNDHFFHEISQWKYFRHAKRNLFDLYRMFRYLGTLPALSFKPVLIGNRLSRRFSESLLTRMHHYPHAAPACVVVGVIVND